MKLVIFATLIASVSAFSLNKADIAKVRQPSLESDQRYVWGSCRKCAFQSHLKNS